MIRQRRRVSGRCHKSKTLGGGGALELRDYRLLFEDCSNHRGALVSDVVALETAYKGCREIADRHKSQHFVGRRRT